MYYRDQPEAIYKALDTAAGYFAASGRYVVERRLMAHLVKAYKEGERRWLVLANRAIEQVELDLQAERTFIDTAVDAFSREIGNVSRTRRPTLTAALTNRYSAGHDTQTHD